MYAHVHFTDSREGGQQQAVGTADFTISGCAKIVICCTESATRHKHLFNEVSRHTPIVVCVSKQSHAYMYVCVHTYILLAAGKVGSHKRGHATPQALLSESRRLKQALFGPVCVLYCATRREVGATTRVST